MSVQSLRIAGSLTIGPVIISLKQSHGVIWGNWLEWGVVGLMVVFCRLTAGATSFDVFCIKALHAWPLNNPWLIVCISLWNSRGVPAEEDIMRMAKVSASEFVISSQWWFGPEVRTPWKECSMIGICPSIPLSLFLVFACFRQHISMFQCPASGSSNDISGGKAIISWVLSPWLHAINGVSGAE